MVEKQAIVVYLPSLLVRASKEVLGEGRPYSDISELVELSVQNQLALDAAGSDLGHHQDPVQPGPKDHLLGLPDHQPSVIAPDLDGDPEALSSFTNRLFPIKVACRVLANSPAGVSLSDFQLEAAHAAREIGRELRAQDSKAGVKGMERRWVALPVGEKNSTLNRFINHFTLTRRRGGPADGPLTRLQLAGTDAEGRPHLTQLGWELASSSNPILDGGAEGDEVATLSRAEQAIMVRAIGSNPAERANLAEFRKIVKSARGRQGSIDMRVRRGTDLSSDEAAAYRAGTIGRLHDLSLVSVDGTGEDAEVTLAGAWPWDYEADR
jgi:hypothetical protein